MSRRGDTESAGRLKPSEIIKPRQKKVLCHQSFHQFDTIYIDGNRQSTALFFLLNIYVNDEVEISGVVRDCNPGY